MSKYHIVGNYMSRFILLCIITCLSAIDEFLLFATEHAIRGIPLSGTDTGTVDAIVPMIGVTNNRRPNNFVAVDFEAKFRNVYFSDIYNKALFYQFMDSETEGKWYLHI